MKICDLFDVEYGINLELVNCQETTFDDPQGVNFVARTSNNNGVVAQVKKIEGKTPHPAGVLTCAGGGSVLSTFVQNKPFYSGRDLYVLTPKTSLTLNEKLYYCMCIQNNAYRYSYGRQANKTLKDIELPDNIPTYVNSFDISPISTKNSALNATVLDTSNWKDFKLLDLFDFERGTRLTKENRFNGDTPLITAGFQNQGVAGYIFSNENKLYHDKITIDMFGNAFYRSYDFYCDDNILVLDCKFKISKYAKLFLTTILQADSYRFSYGRQYRQKDCKNHIICLPVQPNGYPDFAYMENYIKSLPYGDRI